MAKPSATNFAAIAERDKLARAISEREGISHPEAYARVLDAEERTARSVRQIDGQQIADRIHRQSEWEAAMKHEFGDA